ncbi:hypothetical protein GCM10022260_25200 [Gaetbulibacter aestuarii]
MRNDHQRFAGEFNVWNDIYTSKVDCAIAIYGSSRADMDFDPQIIEKKTTESCYNFGMDGHHFWLEYLRHREFLKFNKKPQLIIVSLDIFGLEKRKELYNYGQFLPYMLWNKDIYNFTKSYEGFNKFDYFIPLIRYSGEGKVLKSCVYTILDKNNKKLRFKGHMAMDIPWNSDLEKAKKIHDSLVFKIEKEPKLLFKKFIKECQKKNIQLIFMYPPEYIEGQRIVANRKVIMDYYVKISKEYNIPLFDFSNDQMSFQKKYFYNANHLNKIGAQLFSEKVADTILKYNLQNSLTKKL